MKKITTFGVLLTLGMLELTLSAMDVAAETTVIVVPMAGDVVTIPPSEKIVVDTPGRGNYQTSVGSEGVIDLSTGLKWSKRRSSLVSWEEAREYCTELELDGRRKIWRLPEIDELITLYRFGAAPYIETSVFRSSEVSFWSNTPAARSVVSGSTSPDSHWIAWFTDTRPRDLIEPEYSDLFDSIRHYARCVADSR